MPHVNKVNSKNENNNIKTPTKPKNETGNAFDTKNKNLSLSYVKQAMEKYYKSKLQQGPKGTKITTIINFINKPAQSNLLFSSYIYIPPPRKSAL